MPIAPSIELEPADVNERFDALQTKLPELWRTIGSMTDDAQTIVVIPSLTLEGVEEKGSELQAYEERFLFLLLLLRQPRARLIYVTSQPINPTIIDYYLHLLPGVIPSHARNRLSLISPLDGSSRPLTAKILERPGLIRKIRSLIPDPDRAHLVPYITTELERDLAIKLQIPMYGSDPRHFHHGTKSGCRRLFIEEQVPCPVGVEDVCTRDDLVRAIMKIRSVRPQVRSVIVKLNEGAGGGGNASIDVDRLPYPSSPDESEAIESRIDRMRFEDPATLFDAYMARLAHRGGIVEERIAGSEIRSPSVQMRVTPLGEVELLSTHDQVLGGPEGQSYIGCRFPADASYAATISSEALKIGRRLAQEGVIGRFAVDFVVVRNPRDGWDPYAIEVNLRKGGTTHPFLTLQFLTDGSYDPDHAAFTTPAGVKKYFLASDKVDSPSYRRLTPDDLFDIALRHRLHFDQTRQTGIVFHMMSALSEHGRLGLTAVADSHEEATAFYDRTLAVLGEEAVAVRVEI